MVDFVSHMEHMLALILTVWYLVYRGELLYGGNWQFLWSVALFAELRSLLIAQRSLISTSQNLLAVSGSQLKLKGDRDVPSAPLDSDTVYH